MTLAERAPTVAISVIEMTWAARGSLGDPVTGISVTASCVWHSGSVIPSASGTTARLFEDTRGYRVVWLCFSLLVITAVLGLWVDLSQSEPRGPAEVEAAQQAWGAWLWLSLLLGPFVVAFGERKSVAPHGTQLVCSFFVNGGAFMLALFASNRSTPSWGVGSVLLIGTIAVGTAGAFVRRVIHADDERRAAELAQSISDISSQVATLTTARAQAVTPLRMRERPRAMWKVLAHGDRRL